MPGHFVNSGNEAFSSAVRSDRYVDKTGLIAYTNSVLNTKDAWVCDTRPPGFGKSTTVGMLAAYYSRGCDSSERFAGTDIARNPDYGTHRNQHNVLCFDAASFDVRMHDNVDIVNGIESALLAEIKTAFSEIIQPGTQTLSAALAQVQFKTGQKFIILIDNWDHLLRQANSSAALRRNYLDFLSGLLKGPSPSKYIELAYLTGVLPIVKTPMLTTLNNFTEFTMLGAGPLASFKGFTEKETEALCRHSLSITAVKHWCGGYQLNRLFLCHPRRVINALSTRRFQMAAEAADTLRTVSPYFDAPVAGLVDHLKALLTGDSVSAAVNSFQNELENFSCRDEVLTLFVHLGLLTYDADRQTVRIPNETTREAIRLILSSAN